MFNVNMNYIWYYTQVIKLYYNNGSKKKMLPKSISAYLLIDTAKPKVASHWQFIFFLLCLSEMIFGNSLYLKWIGDI